MTLRAILEGKNRLAPRSFGFWDVLWFHGVLVNHIVLSYRKAKKKHDIGQNMINDMICPFFVLLATSILGNNLRFLLSFTNLKLFWASKIQGFSTY